MIALGAMGFVLFFSFWVSGSSSFGNLEPQNIKVRNWEA